MLPGSIPSAAIYGSAEAPGSGRAVSCARFRVRRLAAGSVLSSRAAAPRPRRAAGPYDPTPGFRFPSAKPFFAASRRGRPVSRGAAPAAPHVPVLLEAVLPALAIEGPGLAVDGTFGAGGYTRALLAADPEVRVAGIDRDPTAITAGAPLVTESGGRLRLVPGRFGELDRLVGEPARWVVLDIGVSSMQLDRAERGFSFRNDGPLDMRMSAEGASAADLVNEAEEAELADIIFHYGEERRSRAVARAIVEHRRRERIETTAQLAALVAGVVRPEPGSPIHPATRTFQGLRIAVNDELGELVRALHAAERLLEPGGRLAVVTFHSLEDRIVKQFLSARSGRAVQASRHMPGVERPVPKSFRPVTKGPVGPSEAEIAQNPRARSAKLRAAERTDAPTPEPLTSLETLAGLPGAAARPGGRR